MTTTSGQYRRGSVRLDSALDLVADAMAPLFNAHSDSAIPIHCDPRLSRGAAPAAGHRGVGRVWPEFQKGDGGAHRGRTEPRRDAGDSEESGCATSPFFGHS